MSDNGFMMRFTMKSTAMEMSMMSTSEMPAMIFSVFPTGAKISS